MYISMDVTFSETEYFFQTAQSTSSPQGERQYDAYNWIDIPQPTEVNISGGVGGDILNQNIYQTPEHNSTEFSK